jgi:ABC-2 type transport system permease protein
MSTLTQTTTPTRPTTTRAVPIPLARLVKVELRKSFDTTSGLWLLASIALLSLLTSGAVIAWSSAGEQTYQTFTLAIGRPISIVLPIIAVLTVTSEWSQRSGLTTFSLVPHRRRVVLAKALALALVAAPSMLLAFGLGALGHLTGTAIRGTEPVWNLTWTSVGQFALGNVLGVLVGFTLGILIRSTAAALVAYFVLTFVIPPLLMLLATKQAWFSDLHAWLDPTVTQNALFGPDPLWSEQWQQLAVTSVVWLAIPLAVGVARLVRAEVK